jgi:hypothetical protein
MLLESRRATRQKAMLVFSSASAPAESCLIKNECGITRSTWVGLEKQHLPPPFFRKIAIYQFLLIKLIDTKTVSHYLINLKSLSILCFLVKEHINIF